MLCNVALVNALHWQAGRDSVRFHTLSFPSLVSSFAAVDVKLFYSIFAKVAIFFPNYSAYPDEFVCFYGSNGANKAKTRKISRNFRKYIAKIRLKRTSYFPYT